MFTQLLFWAKLASQETLTDFHEDEAIFFFKKNIQNGRLKKTEFFNSANSHYFFAKISGIGSQVIVEQIDAKDINVAQPIWLPECLT